MKTNNTISTLKIVAAIVGMIAAACAFWYAIIAFMWACYYAGVPM